MKDGVSILVLVVNMIEIKFKLVYYNPFDLFGFWINRIEILENNRGLKNG